MNIHHQLPPALEYALNRWYTISACALIIVLGVMTFLQVRGTLELKKLTEQTTRATTISASTTTMLAEQRAKALQSIDTTTPQENEGASQKALISQRKKIMLPLLKTCCHAAPESIQLVHLMVELAGQIDIRGITSDAESVTIMLQALQQDRGLPYLVPELIPELMEITVPTFHLHYTLPTPRTATQNNAHISYAPTKTPSREEITDHDHYQDFSS